jgi:hypothetical protein
LPIAGQNGQSYSVTSGDRGKSITLQVQVSREGYLDTLTSSALKVGKQLPKPKFSSTGKTMFGETLKSTVTFGSLKPYLNRINNIHCLETQLYSDYLQVAGTVDCIAEYDGRLSVIDFKTSKRMKSRDDIHGYFMQTAAYAVMFEERTKIPVDTLVILMSVDDEPAQIFVEKRDEWIKPFMELREDYAKIKGH